MGWEHEAKMAAAGYNLAAGTGVGSPEGVIVGRQREAAARSLMGEANSSKPVLARCIDMAESLNNVGRATAELAEHVADRIFGVQPLNQLGTIAVEDVPDREPAHLLRLEQVLRDAMRHAERCNAQVARMERQIG